MIKNLIFFVSNILSTKILNISQIWQGFMINPKPFLMNHNFLFHTTSSNAVHDIIINKFLWNWLLYSYKL